MSFICMGIENYVMFGRIKLPTIPCLPPPPPPLGTTVIPRVIHRFGAKT